MAKYPLPTEGQTFVWWREATGRDAPGTVELEVTLTAPDGLTARFEPGAKIGASLVAILTGRRKPGRARRVPGVEFAALPSGQQYAWAQALAKGAWA